jgi:flagellar hook-basal body complex protein FliE
LRNSGDQKYQGASGLFRSIGEATQAWHDSNANAAGRYTGDNFGKNLSPEAQNYYKQQDAAAKAQEAAAQNPPPATTSKSVQRNHPRPRKKKTN